MTSSLGKLRPSLKPREALGHLLEMFERKKWLKWMANASSVLPVLGGTFDVRSVSEGPSVRSMSEGKTRAMFSEQRDSKWLKPGGELVPDPRDNRRTMSVNAAKRRLRQRMRGRVVH
jgi:hypothetical protein